MLDNRKPVSFKTMLLYLGIPILAILLIVTLFNKNTSQNKVYSDILNYFRQEQVKEYTMNLGSGKMQIYLNDNTAIDYTVPDENWLRNDIKPYIEAYNEKHPDEPMKQNLIRPSDNTLVLLLLQFAPLLILGALLYFFVKKNLSGLGDGSKAMSFGKAKIKNMADENNKTTFKDVAGADEEKAELQELVEFLKNPSKYNELGAKIPKGVLLVGPPGTGKTLLAKAVAGEAGVPFFSMSGSGFVEMFVGVGASRVRDLFDQAKKSAPCIVFIDEIDAIGRKRGTNINGGQDEREQTLNQLLVEMDGFATNEGVIIIAATNRSDILDQALLRPGRFDRQIMVGLPDIKGREEILKVHAANKPLAPDVDLNVIAKSTAGFTGADLANLLNESALLAARHDLKAITMKEIEEATIKVVAGTEKKSKAMSEREKKLTAYHEAGHAVATYVCPTQDPVHQISIIPRGMAGGYTLSLPSEDKNYRSLKEMKEDIVVLLGGRVAESLTMGDISTGASNDLERATTIASSMVKKYGMSEKLGPIVYDAKARGYSSDEFDFGHRYSEKIASEIDKEIYDIISEGYRKTQKILNDNIEKLHEVANFLFKNEKMSGEEFKQIMAIKE